MQSLPVASAFLDYLEDSRQKHLPCRNKSPNGCGMFCSHALSFCTGDHMFLTHATLRVWILERKGMRSKTTDNPEQKCTWEINDYHKPLRFEGYLTVSPNVGKTGKNR